MDQEYQRQRLATMGYGVGIVGLSESAIRKLFRRVTGIKRSHGRYTHPHQSERECARRRQQMAYDAGTAAHRCVQR